MSYTTTSIKEIIARVIRNLDNKLPAYYIDSMLEWIPEAVEELRTPFTLDTKSTPNHCEPGEYRTNNHVVKLPCGLIEILSVQDAYGMRMLRSGLQADITNMIDYTGEYDSARTTDFYTSTGEITTGNEDGPSVPWDGSNIKPSHSYGTITYYDLKMDYLQTSEECMYVKINYKALPIDSEGYPLIPNQAEFKEALYWYVIKKLIASGYQHPMIPSSLQGLEYANQQYEKYAARAISEIKLPDQDRMQKLFNTTVRLIPPSGFDTEFFM